MKYTIMKIHKSFAILAGLITIIATCTPDLPVFSEIIHLKDGQVIRGKIIEDRGRYIKVKTRYQTRLVRRNNIGRIEKGVVSLRKIYMLTRDSIVIKGYLVEQDSLRVVYKENKNSVTNKTISKLDILRMSDNEIRPVDLEFAFKPGIFIPFNSGGADLAPSTALMASLSFNTIVIQGLRAEIDAGFTRSENSDNPERYMQVLPVTLCAVYPFRITRAFSVSPKLGCGMSMVEYNSGQGEEFKGNLFTAAAGLKFQYSLIPRRFFIGLFFDYYMIMDSTGNLHTGIGGLSLSYRI